MGKHGKVALCVSCGLLLVALLWIVSPSAEPSYQGRTFSSWLAQCKPPPPLKIVGLTGAPDKQGEAILLARDQAAEAFDHMGTNALPYVMGLINYEPPAVAKSLDLTFARIGLGQFKNPFTRRKERADESVLVFAALGTNAAPVIPELGRILLAHSPPSAGKNGTSSPPTNPVARRAWYSILEILVDAASDKSRPWPPPIIADALASTNPAVASLTQYHFGGSVVVIDWGPSSRALLLRDSRARTRGQSIAQ